MLKPATAFVAMLVASTALADGAPAFTELTACRLDAGRIAIHAVFDGGACQAVGAVSAAEPRGTIAAVTIAAEPTSDICTMQIVPVTADVVVELPEIVADLDVAVVLAPDNLTQAEGTVFVDDTGPACAEPAPATP